MMTLKLNPELDSPVATFCVLGLQLCITMLENLCVFIMLGIKPSILCMLGKCSTNELQTQPLSSATFIPSRPSLLDNAYIQGIAYQSSLEMFWQTTQEACFTNSSGIS